ncbi:hypothetical protein [Breznakiella homolactica]|uniref:Uncharacterized protein n=1 Tax=Breznakiella homolactica TaxID=2798577 RepID=A0A7T7XK20_9SPIR|nr:hypothetical protein [Breznakiella homolactica]QQO07642.1 hypothetical protein JFL75_11860 [Breznakiella homolactica]
MEVKQVRISYGLPSRAFFDYAEVRSESFPNCDDSVLGGCIVREITHAEKNVCEQCNTARDEWRKAENDNDKD